MSPTQFYRILMDNFPFEPTANQDIFFQKIAGYILHSKDDLFVLKGYAGTGKTNLIAAGCSSPSDR